MLHANSHQHQFNVQKAKSGTSGQVSGIISRPLNSKKNQSIVTENILLYGIHNCDTVKKARKWLDAQDIGYQFVDFRKDGTDKQKIARWIERAGAETVLNKRGTTWRKLSPDQQQIESGQSLVELLCEQPALIKRPVLEAGEKLLIGFSEASYLEIK